VYNGNSEEAVRELKGMTAVKDLGRYPTLEVPEWK